MVREVCSKDHVTKMNHTLLPSGILQAKMTNYKAVEETQLGATASSTNNCIFFMPTGKAIAGSAFSLQQYTISQSIQRCMSHQQPGTLYNLQAEVKHETRRQMPECPQAVMLV